MNIRDKGQNGEREVCDILNKIYCEILKDLDKPVPLKKDQPFQRNQIQTAIGGSDVANPFNLDIEIKRQENLSINSWWAQCVESAERNRGIPILIFRKNRSNWRVMMNVILPTIEEENLTVRAEITLDTFLDWLYFYLLEKI